tara:strand:+ start:740 stop:1039 length:300 start_codon:yes stop_codon:yes gene_type:complete
MTGVQNMKAFIRNSFTEFGLAVGAVVAILTSTVVSLWTWVENPGGIFRGEAGTNWQFVFETAWSWLIPTFMHTVVAVSVVHLLWISSAWLTSKLTNKAD